MAYYNEPFKRRPKPWGGLVGSASKPTITRVLTSDGPLYSPIYETDEGLHPLVPKYQPTTSRGRYSSTPQYDYTMDASAGSATKKKGLGINDWMDALGELKTFTPKFGSASGRSYGNLASAKFSPIPGLNPNYDYSYGGLDFDPLKRQKKMMGSLV
jgi:hypothetical protein